MTTSKKQSPRPERPTRLEQAVEEITTAIDEWDEWPDTVSWWTCKTCGRLNPEYVEECCG